MIQLTLDAAASMQAQQLALEQVTVAQTTFVERMRTAAREISERQGWVTSDDLRMLADQLGLKPDHQNAWGAILRGPGWQVIGRKRSEIMSNHGREIKIWQFIETAH